MGISGISPSSLILILLIVVLLFGTKKIRSMGADIGGALKSFRNAMNTDESDLTNVDKTNQKDKELVSYDGHPKP